MFDIADSTHSLHWFLYDSQEREQQGEKFNVPSDWIRALNDDLQDVNPYVRDLRQLHSLPESEPCALELSDIGQNGDFAAILHASNSTSITPHAIVVWRHSKNEPTFVPIYSRHYEPLQYPVLFPHGTAGWGLTETPNGGSRNTISLTQREWYRSRILTDQRFITFGRLTCEYVCDMYSCVEEERLNFIQKSKQAFAQNVRNAVGGDEEQDEQMNVILPASFMGSRKWASEQTADSLALARTYGPPSLFITMTCNPEWPEISSRLEPGQDASDIPVIVARAFKNRLQRLCQILKTKMGTMTYMTSSIEFQKRGLPHCHIVVQVRLTVFSDSRFNPYCQFRPELPVHEIDRLIKAELPRNDPTLRAKVKKFMTHNPNHLTREVSRCRRGNKCIYGFPHPITSQTTVKDDGRVLYKRSTEEDRWIAPHIPELIDELHCHIFVDVVFTVSIFTYLYKYLYKGPDHTSFHIPHQHGEPVDEIKDYIDGRYLSAPEAVWRILGFHVTSKTPSVTSLPIHMPGQSTPRYAGASTGEQESTSLLIRYFNRPNGDSFANLTYCEYFKRYVLYKWNIGNALQLGEFLEKPITGSVRQKVRPRQVGTKVARIHMVSPTSGELFYLRCLLAHRPACSFTDLRTIDGKTHQTFHEAATDFGLFTNENEGHYIMVDAVLSFCTRHQQKCQYHIWPGIPYIGLQVLYWASTTIYKFLVHVQNHILLNMPRK